LVDWFWSSLVLSILLLWLLWHWPQLWPHLQTTTISATRQRHFKPRTPADCPTCRQARATASDHPPARIPVTPWRERTSRRGAPKRILTHGFACPNRTGLYSQSTQAQIPALLADRAPGQHEPIQTLPCPALRHDLQHAPQYAALAAQNRFPTGCRSADGPGTRLSVAAAVRVVGQHHATITTWLTRAGLHSARATSRFFHNLTLAHLQLDELRTHLRSRVPALWLWVVSDPLTKIIALLHLGARTQDAAQALVHELQGRLAPACLPVFTSDGLNHYF
jgi:hypothetical protein